ncbi:hypothetical protein GCM10009863_32840 [Streptomyces axinellae]|uniref:Uncharacterized protein n=1 Tax=Streptomyces axinellae TaxID=552788 RepID=A0ABP6CJN4_9ACTN
MQLEQAAYDAYVPDVGHVAQAARRAAQQGGDHGLGYEVLRATDTDLTLQRGAAVDEEYVRAVGHGLRDSWMKGEGQKVRVIAAATADVGVRGVPDCHR